MTRTLDAVCPTCDSGPNFPCVTRSGEEAASSHPARVKAGRALPPPMVDFLAYGNFTDPEKGVNGVVVRFIDASPSPWRKIVAEVKKLVAPWLDSGEKKLRFNVDGDPDPDNRALWNKSKKFRHYEWHDGALAEVEIG